MALHDVDRSGDQREEPEPNTHDTRSERMGHNTQGITLTTDGTRKSRIAFKQGAILYYDDQGRVIRVDGFIPGLAVYPVTIIAKYGYDVYVDILGLTAPTV